MIEIKSFAQLGKSLSVKREKDADDVGTLVAVEWRLSDGEQQDLLGGAGAAA